MEIWFSGYECILLCQKIQVLLTIRVRRLTPVCDSSSRDLEYLDLHTGGTHSHAYDYSDRREQSKTVL